MLLLTFITQPGQPREAMKYQLAGLLVYDNEDGSITLCNAAESESQMLTCTAQTILNLLIAHHGIVVERETFLQQVWDDRGLRGSSNSLNQYISILRKMFATLAPEHLFIVTVPKVGFMLSGDIAIVPLDAPAPAEPSSTVVEETVPGTGAPLAENASPNAARRGLNWLYGALTLIVIGFCMATFVWKNHSRQAELYPLDVIDSCPVYTLSPLADVFKERAKKLVRQIKDEGAFNCLPHSNFYVHIQDPVLYGDQGRLVLAQCSQFRGRASACQTLYFYEW